MEPASIAPPVITCDPRRRFGEPCVAGTRVPAAHIAEAVWAGDGVDDVAGDYEIRRDEVLWCCAWWVLEHDGLRRYRGAQRRQWALWADHALRVLGGWEKGVELCDPDDYHPPADQREDRAS